MLAWECMMHEIVDWHLLEFKGKKLIEKSWMGEKCKDYTNKAIYCVVKCNAYKRIPHLCSVCEPAKNISHIQVLVIYFFATPPIKLKGGLQIGGNYQ
jgi:hypothetical protein